MRKNYILPIISFFVAPFLLLGCARAKLVSDWRERQIIIDGKYTDWPNAQSYYDERTKVGINLLNDKDFLYLCLVTRNRQIEINLMESGFTAWFDPDDGKAKEFGIRFPTGLRSMGISLEEKRDMMRDWQDQEDKSGLIDREKERWKDKTFNKHLEELENLQDKLEIMQGPFEKVKKEKHPNPDLEESHKEKHGKELSLEEAAKLGIEAKLGRENDYFVYELKVPLVKSSGHPYAIGVKTDKPIGLGLDTSGAIGQDRPKSEDDIPSETKAGMFSSESLQLWATVELSSR